MLSASLNKTFPSFLKHNDDAINQTMDSALVSDLSVLYASYIQKQQNLCLQSEAAKRSFVAEHPFMVQWFIGSIPHGGPQDLFFIPASLL